LTIRRTLVRSSGRATAPGLKPLRLPRAPDDDVSTIPPNPVGEVRGLGLCTLGALVCDLLSRMGVYLVISWKVGPHRSGALC